MIEIHTPEAWRETLGQIGEDHLLQSWEWGQFKSHYGWRTLNLAWKDADGEPSAAAQVLFRTHRPGLTIGYCPRGPLLDWSEPDLVSEVLRDLARAGRERGAIFFKIDPALILPGSGAERTPHEAAIPSTNALAMFESLGWQESHEQVQFKNTLVVDLQPDEDALLKNMKQKTRYNIRLAMRKGVGVRVGTTDDLDLLYRMFAETALRDNFTIRSPDYYRLAWGSFIESGDAVPLIAFVDEQPVAAIIVYRYGSTAYYLYGMSLDLHREKMPTYLLQWEAMLWAKEAGCTTYDMWGAPDRMEPSDRMYGVYKFKQGFGGRLVETPGAFDLALRPLVYRIYTTGMPLILSIMRRLGRAYTRQSLD